ncbi:MAG TPA: DUF4190 domain-containing protein [Kofleriaceae bacterium]|nr:DUF4190 domain-containing protein [Kofleriaceae bacterium]
MAGQFVVTRNGRDSFCNEDELRKMASRGQLAPGDLVYHPVLGRWLYAKEVEEVKAELAAAATLGQPQAVMHALESNGEAIAGFILGVLGHLPLVGFVCCLCGIYFSGRGLKRAALLENRGHGLAVAGMVLSIVFLVPATACSAVFLAGMLQ